MKRKEFIGALFGLCCAPFLPKRKIAEQPHGKQEFVPVGLSVTHEGKSYAIVGIRTPEED